MSLERGPGNQINEGRRRMRTFPHAFALALCEEVTSKEDVLDQILGGILDWFKELGPYRALMFENICQREGWIQFELGSGHSLGEEMEMLGKLNPLLFGIEEKRVAVLKRRSDELHLLEGPNIGMISSFIPDINITAAGDVLYYGPQSDVDDIVSGAQICCKNSTLKRFTHARIYNNNEGMRIDLSRLFPPVEKGAYFSGECKSYQKDLKTGEWSQILSTSQ